MCAGVWVGVWEGVWAWEEEVAGPGETSCVPQEVTTGFLRVAARVGMDKEGWEAVVLMAACAPAPRTTVMAWVEVPKEVVATVCGTVAGVGVGAGVGGAAVTLREGEGVGVGAGCCRRPASCDSRPVFPP